jgi:hypothetical protein
MIPTLILLNGFFWDNLPAQNETKYDSMNTFVTNPEYYPETPAVVTEARVWKRFPMLLSRWYH